MQNTEMIHETKAKNIVKTISCDSTVKISMNKKFNDVGVFYQIIVEKFLGHENAFLKFKLETNTKNNAKVHCKARVNDNYLNAVQKYYKDNRINYPEYKINIDYFRDANNENHINITFLSNPDEKINDTLDKMIKIFTTITKDIMTKDTTCSTDTTKDIIPESIQNVSVENDLLDLPVAPVAPVVKEDIPVVPVVKEDIPVVKEDIPVALVTPVVSIAVVENKIIPETVSHEKPKMEYCMPPMFNDFELSLQSLDAEKMHIHNFELYIKDMQYNLEIMKKKHSIRIK